MTVLIPVAQHDIVCLRNIGAPVGISKPGSISAKEATGRVPLTALSKQDGEYRKVRLDNTLKIPCVQVY